VATVAQWDLRETPQGNPPDTLHVQRSVSEARLRPVEKVWVAKNKMSRHFVLLHEGLAGHTGPVE